VGSGRPARGPRREADGRDSMGSCWFISDRCPGPCAKDGHGTFMEGCWTVGLRESECSESTGTECIHRKPLFFHDEDKEGQDRNKLKRSHRIIVSGENSTFHADPPQGVDKREG